MGKVMMLGERPLTPRRALARIRKLWDEGAVRWAEHAMQRSLERGLDMQDVQHVIRYGQVVAWSRPRTWWRHEIEGKAVEGRWARVIVEINGKLVIVSVMWASPRRR